MTLPPIHPALVHLPIAFITMSFLADVFVKITRRESGRGVGFWALLVASVGALATVAAGYWDMNRAALTAETHAYVDLHLKFGWALTAALVVLTIWRWRIRQQARRVVTVPYLVASLLVFALTMFQGWYGGELVYSHGAGVAAAGQGTESPEKARERLARVSAFFASSETALGAPGRGTNVQHDQKHSREKSDRFAR